MTIRFTVPGAPVGKGRPRFTRSGHAYTPEKPPPMRSASGCAGRSRAAMALRAAYRWRQASRHFFPLPKSLSAKKTAALDGTPHTKKSNADNVAKAVLDALNGCAYPDDSQIAFLTVRKYQTAGTPRVEVTIEEAGT